MHFFAEGVIFYLYAFIFLFVPGFLLLHTIRKKNAPHFSIFNNAFAVVLISFLLSILVNSIIAIALSLLGLGLNWGKFVLLAMSFFLVLYIFLVKSASDCLSPFGSKSVCVIDSKNLFLTLFLFVVFVLMAVQGGLLDFLADGWWHMSYANQMVNENSVFLEKHFISGFNADSNDIFYPFFWHIQLALLSEAANMPLPLIWHYIAALSVVLLLIAFYLLGRALLLPKTVCILAVVLHFLLIGGLNSYLRIASWPANIAYIFLYFSFYLTFVLLRQMEEEKTAHSIKKMLQGESGKTMLILSLVLFALIGLHAVELVLYVIAIVSYLFMLFLFRLCRLENNYANDVSFLGKILFVSVVIGSVFVFIFLSSHLSFVFSSPRAKSPYLNFIFPALFLVFLLLGAWFFRGGIKRKRILIFIYAVSFLFFLYYFINWSHLADLFLASNYGRHVPKDYFDIFGNRVFSPFWDHQLRGALLTSGLLSILCLPIIFLRYAGRALYFIAATALTGFLVVISPYLFSLVSFVIPLPSVYRLSMLIFSPLIIAMSLYALVSIKDKKNCTTVS